MHKIYSAHFESNLDASCPQRCQTCKRGNSSDGGMPVNSNGICEHFCTKQGYCGNTGAYISGVDCTKCRKGKWSEEIRIIIKLARKIFKAPCTFLNTNSTTNFWQQR